MSGPTLFPTIDSFIEWLRGLSVLRVFWAKPFNNYVVLSEHPLTLLLYWVRGRKYNRGVIFYVSQGVHKELYDQACWLSRNYEAAPILLSGSKILPPRHYDRRGIVYFYDTRIWKGLAPNTNIRIEVYREPNRRVLEDLRKVQVESWGFYKQPPIGDKIFIAYMGAEPVGSAYFNDQSLNVDFGIHVRRRYWRKRIGTRILYEITRYARGIKAPWISIVRVLRGKKPSGSDKKAISFYEANNPLKRLDVYRLSCSFMSV